jgi:hypothetical protein
VGSHASWAATADPSARTAPGRKAFLDSFERQVDPDGTMDPAERARRAGHLRSAHFARMALRSAKARSAKAATRKAAKAEAREAAEAAKAEAREAAEAAKAEARASDRVDRAGRLYAAEVPWRNDPKTADQRDVPHSGAQAAS